MSRKSGNRFSEKDMRKSKKLERVTIQPNRDALWHPPRALRKLAPPASEAAPARCGALPRAFARTVC
jgi:hypothetical protein